MDQIYHLNEVYVDPIDWFIEANVEKSYKCLWERNG